MDKLFKILMKADRVTIGGRLRRIDQFFVYPCDETTTIRFGYKEIRDEKERIVKHDPFGSILKFLDLENYYPIDASKVPSILKHNLLEIIFTKGKKL